MHKLPREGTKIKQVIDALNPDENGISNWKDISLLEKEVGFSLHDNGSGMLQDDRSVGNYFRVQKRYESGKIEKVRLSGFPTESKKPKIPSAIIRKVKDGRVCVLLGTSAEVADHVRGREPFVEITDENWEKETQPLSDCANKSKRHICELCEMFDKMFDARNLNFPVATLTGNDTNATDSEDCFRCYYGNPRAFHAGKEKNNG